MNGPESFMDRLRQDESQRAGLGSPLAGVSADGAFVRKPVEDNSNPYVRPLAAAKYHLDHDVFVIYRPWNDCYRCMSAIKAEPPRLELPEEGDYTCPHTRLREYKLLLTERAEGRCQFSSYESTTLKDGTVQVSVGIARPKTKEELESVRSTEPKHTPRF